MCVKVTWVKIIVEKIPNLLQEKSVDVLEKNQVLRIVVQKRSMIVIINLMLL